MQASSISFDDHDTHIGMHLDPSYAVFRWYGTGQAFTATTKYKDDKQPNKVCLKNKDNQLEGHDCNGGDKRYLCQERRGMNSEK